MMGRRGYNKNNRQNNQEMKTKKNTTINTANAGNAANKKIATAYILSVFGKILGVVRNRNNLWTTTINAQSWTTKLVRGGNFAVEIGRGIGISLPIKDLAQLWL